MLSAFTPYNLSRKWFSIVLNWLNMPACLEENTYFLNPQTVSNVWQFKKKK